MSKETKDRNKVVETQSNRIMAVLTGVNNFNSLTSADIKYAAERLTKEESSNIIPPASTTGQSREESLFKFDYKHEEGDMTTALGLTSRGIVNLERKIEDVFLDCKEKGIKRGIRTHTIEVLMNTLTPNEILWLVDCGISHMENAKKSQAIISMLKDKIQRDEEGPIQD